MPIHPQGDQKLLQLETILGTDQGPPKSTKEELYQHIILKIHDEQFAYYCVTHVHHTV